MALTSIVALVKPPLGSIYRKRTRKKRAGVEKEKSNERSPLWKLNYSCYRRFEPMIRTGRSIGEGGERKFQFIKLLSIRMSSSCSPRPSSVYLLFNHRRTFFTIAYRSISPLLLPPSRSVCVCARAHTHLSPVCIIVFPSRCTHKARRTLPRSRGDAVMFVERMRNAPVYIESTHAYAPATRRICARVSACVRVYVHVPRRG